MIRHIAGTRKFSHRIVMENCLTVLRCAIRGSGSHLRFPVRASRFARQAERGLNTVPVRHFSAIAPEVFFREKRNISGLRTQAIRLRLFFDRYNCAYAQKRAGIRPESSAVLPVFSPLSFRIIVKREKFADLIFMNNAAFFRDETIVCVQARAGNREITCAWDSGSCDT